MNDPRGVYSWQPLGLTAGEASSRDREGVRAYGDAMNCPVCDKPMVALELDEVEVDHCVACGGTWLDAGELELLLDGADNRDELLSRMSPDPSAAEAPRACPICGKKMTKVICGETPRVLVDRCLRGDGIWFDRGELQEVVEAGDFPGDNRVYRLLIDVFGGS